MKSHGCSEKKLGLPHHVIVPKCILYCAQEVTVKTEYGETEWFPIGKGVRRVHFTSLFV